MDIEDEDEFEDQDGAAEGEAEVVCPYCGEVVEITLDPGGGADQEYVEDCQVCCRPWNVHVAYGRHGEAVVSVQAADADEPDTDED